VSPVSFFNLKCVKMTTTKQKQALAVALATALAIPAEGLRRLAYYDPPGVLSVCYGSTTAVEKNHLYSLEECGRRLNEDMLNAVSQVDKCVPGLPAEVLAAFSDAVYNMGPKIVCDTKNSTAARLLKMGNFKAACEQLVNWDKARVLGMLVALPGLTKRREAERVLCLQGVDHV
jgi:lysozyme